MSLPAKSPAAATTAAMAKVSQMSRRPSFSRRLLGLFHQPRDVAELRVHAGGDDDA